MQGWSVKEAKSTGSQSGRQERITIVYRRYTIYTQVQDKRKSNKSITTNELQDQKGYTEGENRSRNEVYTRLGRLVFTTAHSAVQSYPLGISFPTWRARYIDFMLHLYKFQLNLNVRTAYYGHMLLQSAQHSLYCPFGPQLLTIVDSCNSLCGHHCLSGSRVPGQRIFRCGIVPSKIKSHSR
jgi:hypothetical protein